MKAFITTMEGIGGWFAVCMWYNDSDPDIPGGYWEPWSTGFGRYSTKEGAEAEGRRWAEDEEIEFK